MPTRPSEPLLNLLRKVARDRGMNTAALAKAAELDRGHLKHVLAGSEPLTVDELITLAQVLELDANELGGVPIGGDDADGEDSDSDEEPEAAVAAPTSIGGLAMVGDSPAADPIGSAADPYGNHAEQAMRLGIALGTDLHLVLDTAQVLDSGVPKSVIEQFKDRLPIRLDAAFHRHHDVRFLPEAVRVTLSFDSLYTCDFPWEAIQQVTLFPLPPDADDPDPDEDEQDEPSGLRRGHLRLVE